MLLAVAATLCSIPLGGPVTADGGDYLDVPFEVPAGTKEITITHDDLSTFAILDWGVWSPSGFRGWGGGNTETIVVGEVESSRSYRNGPIEPGTWHLIIGKAKLAASDNQYVANVTCSDTTTLLPRARAIYDKTTFGHERRWYAGDFHVHSSESGDAGASFRAIHDLATSRGLQFVNLSDHNTDSHHPLIAAEQKTTLDLLYLRGAEITTYHGHANSVGVPAYVDHRIGFNGRAIPAIVDEVHAAGGLFIVNHPKLDLGDLCIGCSWDHPDTPWDKVDALEIITGNYDVGITAFVPVVIALWDDKLDAGDRIAIVGGSDDHEAGKATGATASPIGSPTTLVLADELSEAAIIAAVKRGRTMVKLRGPMDPDLEVTMVKADGTRADIGDDVDDIARVDLPLRVVHGAGGFVQLWRDGAKIGQAPIDSDDATAHLTDVPAPGDHRYRVEIVDAGNHRLVVTSHFYAHVVPGDDGCGCRSTRIADGLPLVFAILGLRRRRRS